MPIVTALLTNKKGEYNLFVEPFVGNLDNYLRFMTVEKFIELCPICHETFAKKGTKKILSILRCGHVTHQECSGHWFDKNKICPECRTSINKNSLEYLSDAISSKNEEVTCSILRELNYSYDFGELASMNTVHLSKIIEWIYSYNLDIVIEVVKIINKMGDDFQNFEKIVGFIVNKVDFERFFDLIEFFLEESSDEKVSHCVEYVARFMTFYFNPVLNDRHVKIKRFSTLYFRYFKNKLRCFYKRAKIIYKKYHNQSQDLLGLKKSIEDLRNLDFLHQRCFFLIKKIRSFFEKNKIDEVENYLSILYETCFQNENPHSYCYFLFPNGFFDRIFSLSILENKSIFSNTISILCSKTIVHFFPIFKMKNPITLELAERLTRYPDLLKKCVIQFFRYLLNIQDHHILYDLSFEIDNIMDRLFRLIDYFEESDEDKNALKRMMKYSIEKKME